MGIISSPWVSLIIQIVAIMPCFYTFKKLHIMSTQGKLIMKHIKRILKCIWKYIKRIPKCIWIHIKRILELVTIIALIFGIFLGWYKFYYTEKRSSTMHISPKVNVSVGESRKGKTPILLTINIKNTGKRQAYFLPGIFLAHGIIYGDEFASDEEFRKKLNDLKNKDYVDRFSSTVTLIASGYLYVGSFINPDEIDNRSYLFYIPENKYDSVKIEATFRIVNKGKKIYIKYDFSTQDKIGKRKLYCVNNNDPKKCIEKLDWDNDKDRKMLSKLEYYTYTVTEMAWLK